MSVKKSAAAAPREGTASAVREAARSGVPERATSPERPKRRAFTAEFKLRIIRDADAAIASGVDGAVGELLRREGLYSSHLTEWRKQRERGSLAGLAAKKRGPKVRKSTLADENAQLKRELERMKAELAKANTVIDVQRKVAALLGEPCRGPAKSTYFSLYVILDLFSRYIVGWQVATRESAAVYQELVEACCKDQGVVPEQLTIHSDRGSPMTARSTALLYADLGIIKSHSRPYTSNDNPHSEANFRTLKYRPDMPDQLGSVEHARQVVRALVGWYNDEHYHLGLALIHPAEKTPPPAAWINPPATEAIAQ